MAKPSDFFENINKMFLYDSIPNILHRTVILKYIDFLISNEIKFTLFFIDVDYFKDLNSQLGHKIGDEVLNCISKTLLEFNPNGYVGRFGADQFILITFGLETYQDIWIYARDLRDNIIYDNKYPKELNDYQVTVTMGITSYPNDAKTYDDLLETADRALYRGKIKGRNCFVIYNKSLHENIKDNPLSIFNTEQIMEFIFYEMIDRNIELELRISKVLSWLCRYYNIDLGSRLLNGKYETMFVNEVLKIPNIHRIPDDLYIKSGYINTPLFVINFRSNYDGVNKELYDTLNNQNVKAEIIAKISTRNHYYGYFRFDLVNDRIWQKESKILIQFLAHLYASELELEEK